MNDSEYVEAFVRLAAGELTLRHFIPDGSIKDFIVAEDDAEAIADVERRLARAVDGPVRVRSMRSAAEQSAVITAAVEENLRVRARAAGYCYDVRVLDGDWLAALRTAPDGPARWAVGHRDRREAVWELFELLRDQRL